MEKRAKAIVGLTLIALVYFLISALMNKNYEFISYWIILVLLYLFIIKVNDKYKLPLISQVLFSLWSIMHMAGGLVYIGETRLYDLILINIIGDPFNILKFDQFVHAFCYFAFAIIAYFIIREYTKDRGKPLLIITMLAALGIGLFNEVFEFAMVIFVDAGDAVGGYYNTALDLVFNMIGAILGAIYASKIKK